MIRDFARRSAIVTGAGSGIGAAVAAMSPLLGRTGFENDCACVAATRAMRARVQARVRNVDQETPRALAGPHPAGRVGAPEGVSALLSDRPGFIAGSYRLVDGDHTAR